MMTLSDQEQPSSSEDTQPGFDKMAEDNNLEGLDGHSSDVSWKEEIESSPSHYQEHTLQQKVSGLQCTATRVCVPKPNNTKGNDAESGSYENLSSFLTYEQCQFLATLGIYSCSQLVLANKCQVAKAWYDWNLGKMKQSGKIGSYSANKSCRKRLDLMVPALKHSDVAGGSVQKAKKSSSNINQVMSANNCSEVNELSGSSFETLQAPMVFHHASEHRKLKLNEVSKSGCASFLRDCASSTIPGTTETASFGASARLRQDGEMDESKMLKECQDQVFSWLMKISELCKKKGLPLFNEGEKKKPSVFPNVSGNHSAKRPIQRQPNENEKLQSKINCNGAFVFEDSRENGKGCQGETNISPQQDETQTLQKADQKDAELHHLLSEKECSFLASQWIFTFDQLSEVFFAAPESEGASSPRSRLAAAYGKWKRQEDEKSSADIETAGMESCEKSRVNKDLDGKCQNHTEPSPTRCEADLYSWIMRAKGRKRKLSSNLSHEQKQTDAEGNDLPSWARSIPLNGAFSVIFREWFVRFLAVNDITTVPQFLAAKKSETSTLAVAMLKCRASLDNKRLTAGICSRYLKAMSSRIHLALSSEASLDEGLRSFITTPMVAISEMGRKFLISAGLLDIDNFLSEKTTDLSNRFANWREQEKLPPLKGKGGTATVSGWKAAIKEILFLDGEENAGCLSSAEVSKTSRLKNEPCVSFSNDSTVAVDKGDQNENVLSKNPKKRKIESAAASADASASDDNSDSTDSVPGDLELAPALKGHPIEFLLSVGITTSSQLRAASKSESSPLVAAMIKWRRERGYSVIQPSSCVRCLYEWLKRSTTPQAVKNKKSPRKRRRRRKFDVSRALDALSKTSRTFLNTQSVTTAEQFLSTKTMDLATAFVAWRDERGMPELKGSGAIASISSWKGLVRDAIGIDSDKCISQTCRPTSPEELEKERTELLPTDSGKDPSEEDVSSLPFMEPVYHLCCNSVDEFTDLPCNKFSVRNRRNDLIYDFEVDVRESSASTYCLGAFLTYKGARRMTLHRKFSRGMQARVKARPSSARLEECRSRNESDTPISFTSIEHAQFCSYFDGCGLVTLGVIPVDQVRKTTFRSQVNLFSFHEVFSPPDSTIDSGELLRDEAWMYVNDIPDSDFSRVNVLTKGNTEVRYAVHINRPMEKGQVVELLTGDGAPWQPTTTRSLKSSSSKASRYRRNFAQRENITRLISAFSLQDLKDAIVCVQEVLECVKKQTFPRASGTAESAEQCTQRTMLHTNVSVARRRIQWVTFRLRESLHRLRLGTSHETEDHIWANQGLSSILGTIFDDAVEKKSVEALKQEVSDELLYDACVRGKLVSPYDESLWCPLSLELLHEQLQLVSEHKLSAKRNSLVAQMSLFQDIVSSVLKASHRLEEACHRIQFTSDVSFYDACQCLSFQSCHRSDLSDYIALAKLRSGFQSEQDTQWNLFSWHPSALRKEVLASLADAHNFSDIANISVPYLSGPKKGSYSVVLMSEIPWKGKSALMTAMHAHGLPRHLNVFKKGAAKVHQRWYAINQVLAVVHAVVSTGVDWMFHSAHGIDEPVYSVEKLLSALRMDTASIEVLMPNGTVLTLDEKERIQRPQYERLNVGISVPDSLPVFFNLIWPLLSSKYGWRSEKDKDSGGHLFFQAKSDSSGRSDDEGVCLSFWKETIDVPRMSMTLKTVLVKHWEYASANEGGDSLKSAPAQLSVKHVLEKYLESLRKDTPHVVEDNDPRAIFIQGAALYFDRLLPSILICESELAQHCHFKKTPTCKDLRYCEMYSCEYLLRLYVLLPTLLQDAGVPSDEIRQAIAYVDDLFRFLERRYGNYFHDTYLLPREEDTSCVEEKGEGEGGESCEEPSNKGTSIDDTSTEANNTDSTLALQTNGCVSESDDYAEMVRSEDKELLTDFTFTIMQQVHAHRANPVDLARGKRKGMRLGYPGLACNHCIGRCPEGNTFFSSSVQSIATVPSVIYTHLEKCKFVPSDTKTLLHRLKSKHADDRSKLKHGSQAKYYARLWERLHQSKHAPSESRLRERDSPQRQRNTREPQQGRKRVKLNLTAIETFSLATKAERHEGDENLHEEDVFKKWTDPFRTHQDVIKYISQSNQWRELKDVQKSLNAYYRCLALEGKLWSPGSLYRSQ